MSARRKLRLRKLYRRPASVEWRVGNPVLKGFPPTVSIAGGSRVTAEATVLVDVKQQTRDAVQAAGQDYLSPLRFFCSILRGPACKAAREDVELALSDLQKDIRAKRDRGCSERQVRAFALVKCLGVVSPIVWDAMWRWTPRVLLIVDWIRRLKGN